MAGRRAASNRIRGPQSALTDFLASNNISAAQIQADYERRQREAQQQNGQQAAAADDQNASEGEQSANLVSAATKKKRKRQQEEALAKIKEGKGAKKSKKGKKKLRDDGSDDDEYDISMDMYTKKKPLPGQLENCEECGVRFTVTPYSKTGPDGGLLCRTCSKNQEGERKKEEKLKKKGLVREKRRQIQSNLLDGIVQIGTRSLLDQCLKIIGDNIHEIDEFGDLPQSLLDRTSQLLSKKRLLTSRTLEFFLHADSNVIALYDCANLETNDFIKIFGTMSALQKVDLRFAGQLKDEVLDHVMQQDTPIVDLRLDATNLVSNAKWIDFFSRCGNRLKSLKLSSLDYALDDNACLLLAKHCPNLRRLKLRKCFKLGDAALKSLSRLNHLEHLSLQFQSDDPISPETLAQLITAVGPRLRTLSLEDFKDADDEVLAAIRSSCTKLVKFRFTNNDQCTNEGYKQMFLDSASQPLSFVDLSDTRDVNYEVPDGPEEPVGLASTGFEALMEHSGTTLEVLNIHSCRHINHGSFSNVFDGDKQYPMLKDIDVSFIPAVDTTTIAAIIRCCPQLKKVSAFACFNVPGIEVPKGLALIGVPDAKTSIVQDGGVAMDL